LAKRSRTWRRTGIHCSAHSIFNRPSAASPIFFTSCSTMLALVLSPKIVDGLDLPLSSGGFAAAIGSWGRHRRGPSRPPPKFRKGGKAPSELQSCVVPQILHAIGALPGEVGF